jgi:hypothetical protein
MEAPPVPTPFAAGGKADKKKYSSITFSPPPSWAYGPLIIDGQTVTPDGSNNYTVAPVSHATMAHMLQEGWGITTLTP